LKSRYAGWDGPTESHLSSAARLILRDHAPAADDLPSQWLPRRVDAARVKFSDALAEQAAYEAAG
jgi:acyl-CoA dehydrogenase